MRTPFAASLGIAALVAALPDSARADAIAFTALPVIAQPAANSTPDKPDKIPATEHAAGVYAALRPFAQRKTTEEQGYHYVEVFATEREAQQMAADGRWDAASAESAGPRTCLTSGGSLAPRLQIYVRTKPWVPPKPSATEIARLVKLHRWPPPPPKVEKGPQKDTVELIRAERMIPTADGVTIETTEAFLDLQTFGSRPVSKASVRLARIGGGPNDIGIFAARDDKGKSIFVVTNPKLPEIDSEEDRQAQLQQLRSTANRMIAHLPAGGTSETGCGYVRFALTAKPGSGQMATVLATAFLPPPAEADESDMTEEQFESDSMTEDQMKRVREIVHRQNRSQRARPVAINVSLSQLQSEPSPLLSVSLGWAGDDQKLRF
jgi:hypothetical protein